MTKLVALGGAMVAAERMMRRKRSVKSTRDLDDDIAVAGLADVDPEKLMDMGEAVDPEAVEQAHTEIPEQRARLKSVPTYPTRRR